LSRIASRLAAVALVACTASVLLAPSGFRTASVLASSTVTVQGDPSCADPVTSVPTGPATVSAASTPYGRVLVVGSGNQAGCSLHLLKSDQLHALTSAPFACSDNANVLGVPCDTVLWPALFTEGAPIAGPGVNPTLLGTVTRADLPGLPSVEQVTYAGLPLYRFFLDETPGGNGRGQPARPGDEPGGHLVPRRPGSGPACSG
jgi:hypothetical protein